MSLLFHEDEESRILECVDEGLDVFGVSVKTVIYWRFRTIYNCQREDILRKPELFTESLRTFFGDRAFHVEASIVASLTVKLKLAGVEPSDSLTMAVTNARKQLSS